jgi:hypothetical protein
LGQHPIKPRPPAGPRLSTTVTSSSSESVSDDHLDGLLEVDLTKAFGEAEVEDEDEDYEEDEANDKAKDETEDESTVPVAASAPSVVAHTAVQGHTIRTPTAARVENFVFTGQFKSPIPLHQVGMSVADYALGAFFAFWNHFLLCYVLYIISAFITLFAFGFVFHVLCIRIRYSWFGDINFVVLSR